MILFLALLPFCYLKDFVIPQTHANLCITRNQQLAMSEFLYSGVAFSTPLAMRVS